MQMAKAKLEQHRARALKKGVTAADYASNVGISPQRIARLVSEGNSAPPTLEEAVKLQRACKIKPDAWLADN